jgi:protein SCO1/2
MQAEQRFAAELAAGDIQLLSVSFDPARDDSEALRAYRTRYTPDAHGWDLGRPVAAELARWLDAFGVVVIADELGGFAHNAAIHVVDAERKLVAIHDLTDIDGIARSANASLARGQAHVASR